MFKLSIFFTQLRHQEKIDLHHFNIITQPWMNEWTQNKLKYTVFNEHFSQTGVTTYFSMQDISRSNTDISLVLRRNL